MEVGFTRAQLKVASAVLSNLAVVWMVALLGTRGVLELTANIIYAIVSLYLTVKIEDRLEE